MTAGLVSAGFSAERILKGSTRGKLPDPFVYKDERANPGQEAPETDMKLREDLYKKFMSADGIAGRKPYGITTRMLTLVAWKRLETNRPLMFHGVNDTNFPSILRRSLVWNPKGRFIDASILSSKYPNHEADGVFPKDPDLKPFLASGPCIAAGLRFQHGFEMRHDRIRCRSLIEEYAALGGDHGLTEETMRKACGLKPRARAAGRADPAVTAVLSQTPPEGRRAEPAEPVDELQHVSTVITEKILDAGRWQRRRFLRVQRSCPIVCDLYCASSWAERGGEGSKCKRHRIWKPGCEFDEGSPTSQSTEPLPWWTLLYLMVSVSFLS